MALADSRIETHGRMMRWGAFAIILVGGLAPLVFYWLCFGRVSNVTPPQAKEILRGSGDSAILVDVRPSEEFHAKHIDGAQSWPLDEIRALEDRHQIPEHFANKRLFLVSGAGVDSVRAAKHLAGLGAVGVTNVRGGIQEWIGSATVPKGDVFDRWKTASGQIVEFPFRQSPWHEQVAIVLTAFGVKPIYTLLSLALVVVLWRSKAADLVALRWAMIFFFVGENCCAANYLFFKETSYFLEYLHMLGMTLCFGFTTYCVLEGVDQRILMISAPDRKCASLGLCQGCVKYTDAPCGLKRLFYLIIPACIVLAFMPLCADWHFDSYNTEIFGTLYNYSHLWYQQAFELVYCPVVAIALLFTSLLILSLKKKDPLPFAKLTFAAATGPLGFAFLRMTFAGCYSQNLAWFAFWEETTELLFVVGIAFVLWTFRQGLFRKEQKSNG